MKRKAHTLRALALRVLLRLLLLRQMPCQITRHLAHVGQIILIILLRVFLRVFLQDLDNLTSGFVADGFRVAAVRLGPSGRLRGFFAQPVFELGRGHVDAGVEFVDDGGGVFDDFEGGGGELGVGDGKSYVMGLVAMGGDQGIATDAGNEEGSWEHSQ